MSNLHIYDPYVVVSLSLSLSPQCCTVAKSATKDKFVKIKNKNKGGLRSICFNPCAINHYHQNLSLSLSLSHIHTHKHTHTSARARARTHARSHACTHARTHARTHAHTQRTRQANLRLWSITGPSVREFCAWNLCDWSLLLDLCWY